MEGLQSLQLLLVFFLLLLHLILQLGILLTLHMYLPLVQHFQLRHCVGIPILQLVKLLLVPHLEQFAFLQVFLKPLFQLVYLHILLLYQLAHPALVSGLHLTLDFY